MAVACSVIGEPRRGLTGAITGDDKGKLQFKNTLIYDVEVDTPSEAASATYFDAITATGLPKVNLSVYSIGTKWIPYSVCRSKSAKQDPKRISRWQVTCEFISPKSEGGEEDNTPQDKPASLADVEPTIEYSTETIEQMTWEDIDGNAITNPVGEEFAEPVMKPVTNVVATLTFYVATFPWENLALHGNKVNDATWNTKARYRWLITDVRRVKAKIPIAGDPDALPDPIPDTELDVFQATYTIKYTPLTHGWRESRLLIGTKYLAVNTDPIADAELFLIEKENTPTTGFLNLDGTKSATPVYQDFEHIEELDFSFLPLPS